MDERIRQAFQQVQAKEDVKEKTRMAVYHRLYENKTPTGRRQKRLAIVVTCLVIMLIGGGWMYATPTATIGIDSESSLILTVNCFDRVIAVDGTNEAGKQLAAALSVMHCRYEAAVEQILKNPSVAELLAQGMELVVVVDGKSASQCKQMMERMETCVNGHENARCYHGGGLDDTYDTQEDGWRGGNGGHGNGHGYHGGGGHDSSFTNGRERNGGNRIK